jgi:putative ABC transport system permease protein
MGSFLRRLARHVERRRLEREMDEEMAFHLEMKARDLEANGLPRDEARALALRGFGNPLRTRERCEEFWGWRWLHDLATDLRVGARVLARRPAFTATAVLSLTLGIGGVVTIFTIVHSVLLRPLPYRDPDRLVQVWAETPRLAGMVATSIPDYVAWRGRKQLFESMEAVDTFEQVNLTGGDRPEWFEAQKVTAGFFRMLGVPPQLGRWFMAGEEGEGTPMVAVLSHGLWQRRFGGDPAIVGKTVNIDGRTHEIVGVMPRRFAYGSEKTALWTTFKWNATARRERTHFLRVVARLEPGVSFERAQAEMTALGLQSAPDTAESRSGLRGRVVPLKERFTGSVSARLLPLGGAVFFLLLIACANVAGLLVAAGSDRLPETALRSALGAGRGRIVRQLLAESLLIGLAGCVSGLVLARVMVGPLVALSPTDLPRRGDIQIDAVVLLFAVGISLAATAVFGLLPALAGSSPRLARWIQGAGHRATGKGSRQVTRRLLVASQVAVALTLCIGAGLMIRSLHALLREDVGFDASNLLTFQVRLPERQYSSEMPPGPEQYGRARVSPAVEAKYASILEGLRRLPGVSSASAISWLPMNAFWGDMRVFDIVGRPQPAGRRPAAGYNPVDAAFFDTMRIPVVRGRSFNERDTATSPCVAVIDEALAARYWPNENPLGQHVSFATWGDPCPRQIVGVVGGVRHEGLGSVPRGSIYLPFVQQPPETQVARLSTRLHMSYVLRTSSGSRPSEERLAAAVASVDKDLPVFAVVPMEHYLAGSAKEMRFQTLLMVAFGAVAALLATVGIYGVARYTVAQRTHEIGVRMALGATTGGVTRLVLGSAWRMTAAGLAAGVGLAYGLTRFLASMLYSVKPTDAPTYVVVSVVLAIVVAAATYLPARRASRVDPVVALRHE